MHLFAGFLPFQGWRFILLAAGLCLIAYLPAVNNGFISDDYIMLNWVEQWKADFLFLFKIVPDVFRITGYVVLRFLLDAFGFRPEYYYLFSILIHTINTVLLSNLLTLITGSRRLAAAAAIMYAVVHCPLEAVFWLAALADALAGLFVVVSLLFWLKNRFVLAALFYIVGLFSKESAVAALLLLPLVELCVHRKLTFRRQYLYFIAPTLIYVILFAVLARQNYLLSNGFYTLSTQGLLVLAVSMHRLMFPWLYLAVFLFVLNERRKLPKAMGGGLVWMAVTILPFIFLTYQNHIPSRHTYMASMGLTWAVAALLTRIDRAWLVRAFVIAFVSANVAYIWLRKDAQFVQRAAPTEQLLAELRRLPPRPTIIIDFPLNPWMAKMAANMVPGWRPEMLQIEASQKDCPDCPALQWDATTGNYRVNPSQSALRSKQTGSPK